MQNRTISDLGERALIERITRRLAMPSWVVVGPGDDAAVIVPERGSLEVLTTDAQVEGIHFDRRFVPPDAIGHRALAVNLSDLAAMGAHPRAALLSLELPDTLEVAELDGMVDGLLGLAAQAGVALIGGNITRSQTIALHVTAIGTARARRILTRSGARPGDEVYVTGTLGDAATGLRHLAGCAPAIGGGERPSGDGEDVAVIAAPQPCIDRYLRPEPRLRAGMLLGRNRAASSCVDLSDGLADGVRQLASACGVGIVLDAGELPISDEARRWHAEHGSDPLGLAISGGDDYELLFTVRPAHRGRLRAVRQHLGSLSLTRIGVVTKAPDVLLRDDSGTRELPQGFEHFR